MEFIHGLRIFESMRQASGALLKISSVEALFKLLSDESHP